MNFHVLTLFPEVFEAVNHSMIKRAADDGKITINPVNIRDSATVRGWGGFCKSPLRKRNVNSF